MAEQRHQLEEAETAVMQGYFEMMHGRREEALVYFEQAMTVEETRLEALAGTVLGLATNEAGSRALQAIDDFAGGGELSRPLMRLRAICFENIGQREEANAILEELGAPQEPIEHFLEGWSLWRQAAGSEERMQEAYDHFLAAVVLSNSPSPIFHHRLALAAGDLRQEERARLSADALRRFWPDSAFAWEGVGLALEEIDPEEAVAAYRKAIELDMEGRATIHGNLALALYRIGDADAAISEYEIALGLRENNDFAHYGLAQVYLYDKRDLDPAIEHAREAARIAGGDAFKVDRHRLYMRVLVRAGRVEDAIRAGEEALALMPRSISIMRELADVHMNVPDPASAAEVCLQALEIDPQDRESWQILADARDVEGDLEGAVQAQLRRAEVQPRDAEGWRLVSMRQLKVGPDGTRVDPEGALLNARRAVNLLPEEDPYMLHSYACAYMACRQFDEAERVLQHAEELAVEGKWKSDPNIVGYLQNLRQQLEQERGR